MWKAIWGLRIPNKVKLFTRRACHNLLPTKANLFKRKVVQEPSCPCCGREEETLLHALWSCPASQDVWGDNLSCFHKCSSNLTSFDHLLEYSLQRFSCEKVELLTVVARKVWLRRNSWIFEGFFQPPKKIWEEALSSLKDFKSSMHYDRSPLFCPKAGSPSRFSSWKPPPHGKIKG